MTAHYFDVSFLELNIRYISQPVAVLSAGQFIRCRKSQRGERATLTLGKALRGGGFINLLE